MEPSTPPCSGDPRRVFWHEFVVWHELASDAELAQLEASLVRLATLKASTSAPPSPVLYQILQQALRHALVDSPASSGIPGSLQQRLAAVHWPPATAGP